MIPEKIYIVADRNGPYSEFMYEFRAQADDIGYIREDIAWNTGLEQAREIVRKISQLRTIFADDEILCDTILQEIETLLGEKE